LEESNEGDEDAAISNSGLWSGDLFGSYLAAQGGGDQKAAPIEARLRETVAKLRAGRIATPTDYDRLNAEHKAYVASILSGPRADISGPLGVMMVSPALGDLTQKAMAYSRFAGQRDFRRCRRNSMSSPS
jgi:hypothetical protein